MDPILFIITLVAAAIAGAAILLPSERSRPHHWADEEYLRDQLGASSQ